MIKSGAVKQVMLMAFLGVILIAAVGSTSGRQMENQGNTTGQGNMMAFCPCNGSMMHCMMGEPSENGTMMHCMMMNGHSANESNGTMMHCHCMMDQNNSMAQKRLDCATFWLKKAIELHDVHIKDPSTATNESQMEMMEQMQKAYVCLTGKNMTENMTMDMMTNTTAHASEAH
jgi:hypothetical protein